MSDLSKCGVCGGDAQFTDADPGANPVSYDAKHLPEHFRGRAEAGQMPLQDGSTVDDLQKKAKKLDIEGRSTMTKAQLQTAVAASKATEMARERNARVDPRVPRDDRPLPVRPVRLTPEAEAVVEVPAEVAQVVAEPMELEGGSMSDAPADIEVLEEEPEKKPRKASRKK